MRINEITLLNFGPYQGIMSFDTSSTNEKNIILIGGKNGAGKTTLFTAMKVCLYGYQGMGYKNTNNHYYNAIKKLINNSAKMTKPTYSHVQMTLEISNRRGLDRYELIRSWILDNGVKEKFEIIKNDQLLSEEETTNFEKFLLAYIPPELFNLYFFDGEKISDFFLNDGSNKRIKDAFLTICGYDTFNIMKQNFKRVASQNKSIDSTLLDEYLTKKELKESQNQKILDIQNQINEIAIKINEIDSELKKIEKDFNNAGGASYDVIEEKSGLLKLEEKKREELNHKLKDWSNTLIPFIMIKNNLVNLKNRILKENESLKYRNFIEVLNSELIKNLDSKYTNINEIIKDINEIIDVKNQCESNVLNLSFEDSANLIAKIDSLLSIDADIIHKTKKEIKKSIKLSAKIRKELDMCDVSLYKEYMDSKNELTNQKHEFMMKQLVLEKEMTDQLIIQEKIDVDFNKVKSKFEENLKEKSKMDISSKSILMLESLEEKLYKKQIEQVRLMFIEVINKLMRKTDFADNVLIDEEFNIRIYKKKPVNIDNLVELFMKNSINDIAVRIGQVAVDEIFKLCETTDHQEIQSKLLVIPKRDILLSMELDKDMMSNGEKQIYIMALYYSLVSLANQEIPFVIDTPFARIDREHRNNISEHFFKNLKGQVFILSTNEEINENNFEIIKDNVSKLYMLENTDNSHTRIIKNTYFEV